MTWHDFCKVLVLDCIYTSYGSQPMILQDTLKSTLQQRLLDIATEIDALKEESKSIKQELVSRTTPYFKVGQILQRMNEFGVKKNIRVLDAIPASEGWRYRCEQAGEFRDTKILCITEPMLFDLGLKDKDFYITSPKHEAHRKPKRQKKGDQDIKSVEITPATQDKINALLNL